MSLPRFAIACLLAASWGAPVTAQCTIGRLFPESVEDARVFANAVGIEGSVVVVGEEWNERAYLFDASDGTELFRLTASDGANNHNFGTAVAISDGIAAVGSSHVDSADGAVYLFDAATGIELRKLVPPVSLRQRVGASVDLQGDRVVAGATGDPWLGPYAGAVHVFETSTGAHLARLVAYDGGPDDRLGAAVALDGNWIVAGAPGHADHFGTASGAAYVFDATTGQLVYELLQNPGGVQAGFGTSVAVSGDLALVGAPGGYNHLTGSAHLFDLTTGEELHRWDVPDYEAFGISVALEGTTVLVGAYLNDAKDYNSGAVYRFDAITGALEDIMTPPDVQLALFMSRGGVALSEGRAVVGAPNYDDPTGYPVGTAYLFSVASEFGTAYCPPSTANSLGLHGVITAQGCDAVAANDLRLTASSLPRNRFAYFLASPNQGFVPMVGGGQGNLCLGSPLARYAAQGGSTGNAGERQLLVDLNAIPTLGAVTAGETWNFQCWYRDANPGPTSNLTEGYSILFR